MTTKIIADDIKIRAGEVPVSTSDNSTVKLLSDVTGGSISIDEIEGNPFVNNLVGADGDSVSHDNATSEQYYGETDAAAVGDIIVVKVNVKTNTLNAGIAVPSTAIGTTVSVVNNYAASATGITYIIHTITALGGASGRFIGSYDRGSVSGAATFDLATYNLSTFGIITPTQYATLVSQGVTGMTLGTSTWVDIYAQLTDAILAKWIPSHVSGYMPSIMDSVVNRGENLAYFDGNKLNQNGRPDNSGLWEYVDGKILITSAGISTANKLGFAIPIEPNTKYSFSWSESGTEATNGMFIFQHSAYPVDATNPDTLVFTANVSTSSFYTVTSEVNARYFVVAFDVGGTPPSVGAYIGPIQLNEGATAFDYTEPLNDVKVFGQRSPNLLMNGNGENNLEYWTKVGTTDVFSNDGTEFTIAYNDIGTVNHLVDNISGTFKIGLKSGTAGKLIRARVYSDELATAPSGWTYLTDHYYIASSLDTYVEVSGVFENITKIGIIAYGTAAYTVYFKEAMILKGSYTLAQLQALGYQSYNPVVLHAVSDGLQMYYDKVKSIDNTLSIEQNVDSDGYTFGDPILGVTEYMVNHDFSSGDLTGWTISGSPAYAATNTAKLTADGTTSNGISQTLWGVDAVDINRVYVEYEILENTLVGSTSLDLGNVNVTDLTDKHAIDTTVGVHHIYLNVYAARSAGPHTTFGFTTQGGSTSGYVTINFISVKVLNYIALDVPTIEDISEFCPPLSLAANVGNNHVVSSFGGAVFTMQSYTTLAGMQEMIKDLQYSKADRDELPIPESLSIVTTAGIGAGLSVYYSYHLIGGMPDVVKGAFQADVNNYHANVASVEFWDNGVVVTANGSGVAASAVLFTQKIGTSNPFISYTGV